MKNLRYFVPLVLVAFLLLVGCSLAPLRVFQAKVPDPIVKTEGQQEADRRAADLLARKLETPVALKPVAVGLSASLGAPKKSLQADTPAELERAADQSLLELRAGMLKLQQQIESQNKFLAKYAGKEIEGTGLSLLGPGMTALVIGLIVLAVACPPVMTLMFFAFRRLKAAASIVVNEVEAAAQSPETKQAVEAIKGRINTAMQSHPQRTTLLKSTITDLKK
jgi:hypothetical protein